MIYEDIPGAFQPGENVHVVEHRRFESELRRHFIGRVLYFDANYLRVRGFMFVYDHGTGSFAKVPAERIRVFSIDNRISITVLPEEFDIAEARYERNGPVLAFSDGKSAPLDLGAFSSHG